MVMIMVVFFLILRHTKLHLMMRKMMNISSQYSWKVPKSLWSDLKCEERNKLTT